MFDITSYQGNANQDQSELPRCTLQDNYNKKDRHSQVSMRKWRNWNSHTLLVGLSNGPATLENSLTAPYKVKRKPCDPAIPFLGLHPRDVKIYVHAKTCT